MQSDKKASFPQQNDIPDMKELWLKCFPEDSERAVNSFFELVFDCRDSLVIHADGAVRAMLFLIPCVISVRGKEVNARYLYCVCTDESYRGRGYMTGLLECAGELALQRGCEMLVLLPATDSLYGMYHKLGFTTELHAIKSVCTRECMNKSEYIPCEPDAALVEKIKRSSNNTTDCCILSNAMLQYIVASRQTDFGAAFVKEQDEYSYCLFEKEDSAVRVLDAFSTDGNITPALSYVFDLTAREDITVLSGVTQQILSGEIIRFGLLRSLTGDKYDGLEDVFLGLVYG